MSRIRSCSPAYRARPWCPAVTASSIARSSPPAALIASSSRARPICVRAAPAAGVGLPHSLRGRSHRPLEGNHGQRGAEADEPRRSAASRHRAPRRSRRAPQQRRGPPRRRRHPPGQPARRKWRRRPTMRLCAARLSGLASGVLPSAIACTIVRIRTFVLPLLETVETTRHRLIDLHRRRRSHGRQHHQRDKGIFRPYVAELGHLRRQGGGDHAAAKWMSAQSASLTACPPSWPPRRSFPTIHERLATSD